MEGQTFLKALIILRYPSIPIPDTDRFKTENILSFCLLNRYLSRTMAKRIASWLWSSNECTVRNGFEISTEKYSFLYDFVEKRRHLRSSRRRWWCWTPRPGCWSGQTSGRRTGRLCFKIAKWWTAGQAAILLRTILYHQENFVPGI